MATAIAVTLSDVNMAIHNSGENGKRNARRGISDLVVGAASNETPLWKYGTLKSMASARALNKKRNKEIFRNNSRVSLKMKTIIPNSFYLSRYIIP